MRKDQRNDDAFTGLEAAIVLIAFVVVAAVFSYVVLGAGFFTTQKSQETIYTGTKQASNNLATTGPVVMQADATEANKVNNLSFTLKLASGANDVDMSKITYTVSTAKQTKIYIDQNSTTSGYAKVVRTRILAPSSDDVEDNLLEPNEIYQVLIELRGQAGDPATVDVGTNELVSIEIKPDVGASLLLQKRTPAGMQKGGVYEVY
ncbi:MAG: flagellin [Methanolinea sp.]|nr:flagellin [Methanolinea sp.]